MIHKIKPFATHWWCIFKRDHIISQNKNVTIIRTHIYTQKRHHKQNHNYLGYNEAESSQCFVLVFTYPFFFGTICIVKQNLNVSSRFYVSCLNGHKTKQTMCLLLYNKTDRTLIENWQESEWINERIRATLRVARDLRVFLFR